MTLSLMKHDSEALALLLDEAFVDLGARAILADWLEDHGDGSRADLVRALCIPPEPGEHARYLYRARKDRAVHPAGDFDRQGRWHPDACEDCGDIIGRLSRPSAAYPYRYLVGCRTLKHCRLLVAAWGKKEPVPWDVTCWGLWQLHLLCLFPGMTLSPRLPGQEKAAKLLEHWGTPTPDGTRRLDRLPGG